jgi:hypothetical protein
MGTALPRADADKEATNLKDSVSHLRSRVTMNGKGDGPSHRTEALITSYRTKTPVRVFRSFGLAPIVKMRPLRGFRYDGLYVVTEYELLKKHRQIYRFKMERMADGQGPLRENLAPPLPKTRKRQRNE